MRDATWGTSAYAVMTPPAQSPALGPAPAPYREPGRPVPLKAPSAIAPEPLGAPAPEPKPPATGLAQALGLVVSELPEAQKKELKIKGGVKIDTADGAAARAGLREGDVIMAIANVEVANLKEFEAALAKVDKTKAVNVLYRRGEWAQYALIRPLR